MRSALASLALGHGASMYAMALRVISISEV